MAISTTNTPAQTGHTFPQIAVALTKGAAGMITGFFQSLNRAITVNSTVQMRLIRVQRLQALTDAELAAKGLKRDDIVHHVFRDLFWN